jgi:hypothetical protein
MTSYHTVDIKVSRWPWALQRPYTNFPDLSNTARTLARGANFGSGSIALSRNPLAAVSLISCVSPRHRRGLLYRYTTA